MTGFDTMSKEDRRKILALPQSIPVSEYASYNKTRSAKDMFWLVEYTTKYHCAMIREDGWKY